MTTKTIAYVIAVLEILFGAVGYVTGWATSTEALAILTIGLSTFGIHQFNAAVAAAKGITGV